MKSWYENLIIVCGLLLFLSLTGCTSMLIGNALDQGKELTPAEIKAYNEIGFDLHSCTTVAGPPPAGKLIKILTPKTANIKIKFGDNCQVIQ